MMGVESTNRPSWRKGIISVGKKLGVLPLIRFFYFLPGTMAGFFRYTLLPKKEFVLIISSMRSGSTLLKALLSQAPDIEQIPESEFQVVSNKYHAYNLFYKLSDLPIILLKHPSNYIDFESYPRFPSVPFKAIILVRNPLDTAISLKEMNPNIGVDMSDNEVLNYWATTYENIAKREFPQGTPIVLYSKLIESPKQVTQSLFEFIGSRQKSGVDTYERPKMYNWQWKKDDGGEVIKSLKVQKVVKDYTGHKCLIEKIHRSNRVQKLIKFYRIEGVSERRNA